MKGGVYLLIRLIVVTAILFNVHAYLVAARNVGAKFLLYEHNARVVGLGGAFVALADDGDAVYWNPAGLAFIDRPAVTLTHYQGFMNMRNDYLNAVYPFGRLGTLGMDFSYSAITGVDIYDDFGLKMYELQNYDVVADLGWGLGWNDNISSGIGLKFYTSKLDEYVARGIALDIGFLLRDYPLSNLSLGCSLQNLGPGITYIKVADPLPLNLKVGPAYRMNITSSHALTVSMEFNYLMHKNWSYLNTGAEYSVQGRYFLRCGYRLNRTYDNLSVGMGVSIAGMGFDYALLPFDHLGLVHRLSLSFRMPSRQPESTPEEVVPEVTIEAQPTQEPTQEATPAAMPSTTRYEYAFKFSGDLLFDSGQAELKPVAYPELYNAIMAIGQRYPDSQILVAGHTDNVPLAGASAFLNNYELSVARADAVRQFLIQRGLDADRVAVIGYGDTKPIASNETSEGRQANRRVELIVYGETQAGAQDLVDEAVSLFSQGDYKVALVRLLKAVELDPANALAHRVLGNCYYNMGEHGKSRQAFEKSLKLNPMDMELRDFLEGWK